MDFEKLVHMRESPKKERFATKGKEHVRESQNEVENFDDWLAAHMLLPFDEHMYLSTQSKWSGTCMPASGMWGRRSSPSYTPSPIIAVCSRFDDYTLKTTLDASGRCALCCIGGQASHGEFLSNTKRASSFPANDGKGSCTIF